MPEAVAVAGSVPAESRPGFTWAAAGQRYLASAAWRFGGAGAGALGAVLAARWLGPAKLGLSGVAQSVLMVALLFALFGQDIALVRTYRNETDAAKRHELVNDVFWGRLLTSLVIGLALLGTAFLLDPGRRFQIAAPAAFLLLLVQATSPAWILQAMDDVPAQQRFAALQAGLMTVMTVLILRPLPRAGMDLAAQAIAAVAVGLLMWRYALHRHTLSAVTWQRWKNYLVRAREHHWLFLSAVVIYLYVNFQQLLVASLCSITELGLYRPALQVTQAIYPFLALIPAILYPRMIDWAREGPAVLLRRQLQLLLVFSLLLVPAVAFAFLAFPWLFPRVFGVEFAAGAIPCALLLTSKGFVVLNSLFTWGLWAQKRDKSMLVVTSLVAALSLSLNVWLIPRFGAMAASSVACLSEVGVLTGSMVLSFRRPKNFAPA